MRYTSITFIAPPVRTHAPSLICVLGLCRQLVQSSNDMPYLVRFRRLDASAAAAREVLDLVAVS